MSSRFSGTSPCIGCLNASTLCQLWFSGEDLTQKRYLRSEVHQQQTEHEVMITKNKPAATHQGLSACAADLGRKQPPQQARLLQPGSNSIQQEQVESQCVPPFLLQCWASQWWQLPHSNKNHTGQNGRHKSVPFGMLSMQKSAKSQQSACRTDGRAE